jgi:hypothetical protein
MEGAALAQARAHNLATRQAWDTANFAIGIYAGKLKNKKLADFLIDEGGGEKRVTKESQALSFFHRMKAQGRSVRIERVIH